MPEILRASSVKQGMTRAAVWETSFLIHGSTQDAAYCLFSLQNIGRVRLNSNVRGRLAEVKTGSARARVHCHKIKKAVRRWRSGKTCWRS